MSRLGRVMFVLSLPLTIWIVILLFGIGAQKETSYPIIVLFQKREKGES